MAELRCETCGGIEVEDAFVCSVDAWASAVEAENTRLRNEIEALTTKGIAMLTTLIDKLLTELDESDLADLASRVAAEQRRRREHSRPRTCVEDLRAALQRPKE